MAQTTVTLKLGQTTRPTLEIVEWRREPDESGPGGLRVQRRHPPDQGKLPDAGSRRLTTDQPGKRVSTTLDPRHRSLLPDAYCSQSTPPMSPSNRYGSGGNTTHLCQNHYRDNTVVRRRESLSGSYPWDLANSIVLGVSRVGSVL